MKKSIDRVLWITLEKRTDRQHSFGRNLGELGTLPVQRLNGFDARRLGITNDWSRGLLLEGAGAGIVGCYLSHLHAIQIAVLLRETVLVLEDDVILSDNFLIRLEVEMQQEDSTILTLGGTRDGKMECGTHAYVVDGLTGAKVAELMGRNRTGGVTTFFRDNASSIHLKSSGAVLAKQNHNLHSDLRGEMIQMRTSLSSQQIKAQSHSQYGEDRFVSDFFKKERSARPDWAPRFLEIGALDGMKDSNCFLLSLEGWRGVCIEPHPYHFVRLHQNYLNSKIETLCALVGPKSEIRTLHLNNDGLTTSDPSVFDALHKRVYYASWCRAPVVTPDQIANLFGNDFDFVSIDAEGMDISIVRASQRLLTGTKLLCIETDKPGRPPDAEYQKAWDAALSEIGFTKVVHKTQGNTLVTRP